jgi:hypothetical protein
VREHQKSGSELEHGDRKRLEDWVNDSIIPSGYEINEGGNGTITIDLTGEAPRVHHEWNERVEAFNTTTQEYAFNDAGNFYRASENTTSDLKEGEHDGTQ